MSAWLGDRWAITGDIDEIISTGLNPDYESALAKQSPAKPCHEIHTFPTAGERLTPQASLTSELQHVRMAQIQSRSTVVQEGDKSNGHCKYALDLDLLHESLLPFHVHWVGGEGHGFNVNSDAGRCSRISTADLSISHLEVNMQPHRAHGQYLGMWENPRLKTLHIATKDELMVDSARAAMAKRVSTGACPRSQIARVVTGPSFCRARNGRGRIFTLFF